MWPSVVQVVSAALKERKVAGLSPDNQPFFTLSARVRRQSLPLWPPTLNKRPLPLASFICDCMPCLTHFLFFSSFFSAHAAQPESVPVSFEDLVSGQTASNKGEAGPVSAEQLGKQVVIVRYLEVSPDFFCLPFLQNMVVFKFVILSIFH